MEQRFKATIVWLIFDGKAEKALHLLAERYGVNVPKIKVGLPKRRKKKSVGCYSGKHKTISVLNSEALKDPFIVLHEFYHHLRTGPDAKHRGTEKYADEFAKQFILAYKSVAAEDQGNN